MTLYDANGMNNFILSYSEKHSIIGKAGSWDDDTQPVDIHVNGILTILNKVQIRCNLMSEKANGKIFHYVYNATNGFIWDIVLWAGQRLGMPTKSANQLVAKVREIIIKSPGRCIRLWLHSQGGEIGAYLQKVLSKEELSIIEVNTFGSASLFKQGHFARVSHYIGTCDWVPFLTNPIKYAKACFGRRPDIKFIKIHSARLLAHSMDHYYAPIIQHLLKDID